MKRGATTLLFPDIDIRYTRNLRIHDMKSDGDYLLLVLFCDRIYVLIRLIIYSYTTNSLILSFQNTVINLYGKIFLLQVDQSVQMTAFSHQGFARKICKVQSLCERHKTPKKCAFKWKDYCVSVSFRCENLICFCCVFIIDRRHFRTSIYQRRVLGFRLKQFAGFTSNDPDLDLSQELILELV